jgi:transposase
MSIPMAVPMAIQRVEVITGKEGRRRFSEAEKRQLVEEAFQPGVKATEIARRHGMDVSLLYRWRRLMFGCQPQLPAFTPVAVVENAAVAAATTAPARPAAGVIEIELAGGARVRVTGAVEASLLASVIAALAARR